MYWGYCLSVLFTFSMLLTIPFYFQLSVKSSQTATDPAEQGDVVSQGKLSHTFVDALLVYFLSWMTCIFCRFMI